MCEGAAYQLCPLSFPLLLLQMPSPVIEAAGLFPSAEQLVAFSHQLPPSTPLADLIDK